MLSLIRVCRDVRGREATINVLQRRQHVAIFDDAHIRTLSCRVLFEWGPADSVFDAAIREYSGSSSRIAIGARLCRSADLLRGSSKTQLVVEEYPGCGRRLIIASKLTAVLSTSYLAEAEDGRKRVHFYLDDAGAIRTGRSLVHQRDRRGFDPGRTATCRVRVSRTMVHVEYDFVSERFAPPADSVSLRLGPAVDSRFFHSRGVAFRRDRVSSKTVLPRRSL